MRRSKIVWIGLLVAVLCSAACPEKTAVWIPERQSVTSLEFVLGRNIGHEAKVRFYGLRVEACAGSPPVQYWAFGEGTTGVPVYPTRVQYGQTPPGFREVRPALPLGPGCYVTRIGGSGVVFFNVDSLGAVLSRPAP